jgi:hypothetical protein
MAVGEGWGKRRNILFLLHEEEMIKYTGGMNRVVSITRRRRTGFVEEENEE